MQCPTEDKLIQLAFGLEPEGEENVLTEHLGCCAACGKVYESARETAQLLRKANEYLDADHEAAKAQLLKALPESVAQKPNRKTALTLISFFQWIGGTTMQSRILAGGVLGTILLFSATVLLTTNSSNSKLLAMERVVSRLQNVRTATWTMTTDLAGDTQIDFTGSKDHYYWSRDKGSRVERYMLPKDENTKGERRDISVSPVGEPGTKLFYESRHYVRQKTASSANEPGFAFFLKLENFRGQADRDLGFTQIDGRTARGFEIDMKKVVPDSFPGTMRLWADVETALPLRCEMTISDMLAGADMIQRLEYFEWDVPLDDSLFVVNIPENFQELEGPPEKSGAEKEKQIVKSLQIYVQEMGGYPQVEKIYPDALLNEFHKRTGYYDKLSELGKKMRDLQDKLSKEGHPEKIVDHAISKEYFALQNATEAVGEGLLYLFQKQNAKTFTQETERDLKYHGLKVKPGEVEKLLLRWRLDDGRYRALFGDLHYETIGQSRLDNLEAP